MFSRLVAYLAAIWGDFKTWLGRAFSIKMGDRNRWPGFINIIPGVTKGYDIATSGEAFILVIIRDYTIGIIQFVWTKLTQAPAYLISPIFSYNDSSYSWTTLLLNMFRWFGARGQELLAFLRRLL